MPKSILAVHREGGHETYPRLRCPLCKGRPVVKRNGRSFDVVETETGRIIEGGFFEYSAAWIAAREIERGIR